jgi:hypothetical protein
MLFVSELPSVRSFDQRTDTKDAFAARGVLLAGAVHASSMVYPGLQLRAIIGDDGRSRLGETGLTIGDADPRLAAGQVILQTAYNEGFPPGHAGLHGDRNHAAAVEVLAAQDVRERLVNSTGPYVGFLLAVRQDYFYDSTVNAARATRGRAPVEEIVGLALSDVNFLVGPGGIQGLADPVDVPAVRAQFAEHGLRPEVFGTGNPG